MKRLVVFAGLLALIAYQSLAAQSTLRRVYDDLEVELWTDKDDGSNYKEGDAITIYFRASQDCYVTVYDLDTRGNVNLIFPEEYNNNHFVRGGEIYMIPERSDEYELTVEGPPGTEHVQMVASVEFYPVPDWQGPISVYDDDVWGFKYEGENEEFIAEINAKFFPESGTAYDHVSFYVAPAYYYKPEKKYCYGGDCGTVYIDYPYGCDVYVNGVFYGVAPLWIPSIYLGRHRITVYWGSSILYNDWVYVYPYEPFYLYTRPFYVYDYCYNHWYHHHGWDDYYYPSRYKYKRADYYSSSKPQTRRGYEIVSNSSGYGKSKSYTAEKVKRLDEYKVKHGFDVKTKVYTASKPSRTGDYGQKSVDRGKVYDSKQRSTTKERSTKEAVKKRSDEGYSGRKSTQGKGESSGKKSGTYDTPGKKRGGSSGIESGKKREQSSGKSSSDGGESKKSSGNSGVKQSDGKKSGGNSGKVSSPPSTQSGSQSSGKSGRGKKKH